MRCYSIADMLAQGFSGKRARAGLSLSGLVCALLLSGGLAAPARAQTCAAFTYNLTNGTTADANQVMSNFNTVRNCANTLASGGTLTNTTLSGTTTISGTLSSPTLNAATLTGNTQITGQITSNVGIGINAGEKLSVYNPTTTTGTRIAGVYGFNTSGEGAFTLSFFDPADAAQNRLAMNLGPGGSTFGYYWTDNSGNLRTSSTFPTNTTSGTVVGTQTSTRESKIDIERFADYDGALRLIEAMPLSTFRYKNAVDGYGREHASAKKRLGFVADEVNPLFMWEDAIDQVSVNGALIASVKALNDRLRRQNAELAGEIDGLRAELAASERRRLDELGQLAARMQDVERRLSAQGASAGARKQAATAQ
jgi:hypothetical protein